MKTRRHFKPEEKQKFLEKVAELQKGGQHFEGACKEIGIISTTVRNWRNKFGKSPQKKKEHVLVQMAPHAPKDENVFVFFGKPKDVANIVRSMQ